MVASGAQVVGGVNAKKAGDDVDGIAVYGTVAEAMEATGANVSVLFVPPRFTKDAVEEAVLQEFEALARRGGVLGAMETQYQRSKIQDESLHYEKLKHDGTLPIIGVNTWLDPATTKDGWEPGPIELRRASPEEKQDQIRSVREFQARHADESGPALARLQQVAMAGGNVFAELMSTVRVATLGQITKALYAVGGEYRRNL